jgi:hypothetical protein
VLSGHSVDGKAPGTARLQTSGPGEEFRGGSGSVADLGRRGLDGASLCRSYWTVRVSQVLEIDASLGAEAREVSRGL